MKLRLALALATAAAAVVTAAGCATQGTDDDAAKANAQNASRTAAAPAPAPQSSFAVGGQAGGQKVAPMTRSIYYEYDKAEITAEGKKIIEANAEYLRSHPGVKVVVEGNADERGSAEYNVALGQRRADSVSKIMSLLGILSDRVETVSYGKEKPKVTGHDESSWSQNRRSDIVYR